MTNAAAKTETEIARTILSQIGGSRALYMLGASKPGRVLGIPSGVMIKIQGSKKINMIRIELDPSDTYRVRFQKCTGGRWSNKLMDVTPYKTKEIRAFDGVYFDQLPGLIEETTGLYLSL